MRSGIWGGDAVGWNGDLRAVGGAPTEGGQGDRGGDLQRDQARLAPETLRPLDLVSRYIVLNALSNIHCSGSGESH